MSLQKFRADVSDEAGKNGAIAWWTRWIGGPTLALVRNCPIERDGELIPPRTVYATDHPDTFFSIPAACMYRKKVIRGFLTIENGEWRFVAYSEGRAS